MKAKLIVVALTSLFAFSLTACDRNKHPASGNSNDPATTTANALDYNRSPAPATDNTATQSDVTSPGHGPVPNDARKRTPAVDNNLSDNTDTMIDHSGDSANSTMDSTSTNPNDIANPNPTTTR